MQTKSYFIGVGYRHDYVSPNFTIYGEVGFGVSLNDKNVPTIGTNVLMVGGTYNIKGW